VNKLPDKGNEFEDKEVEDGVKSTKGLIQSFLQALKAYRLYEASHPILSKFLDRVRVDFERYFEEFDSFSLQVTEHRLFYRGKVVYESQDVKESLSFLFFRDGIRELRFFKGLDFKEIVDFLDIVRKSDLVSRMEDDLVTLLWGKDFIHIDFVTIDEFLESGGVAVPATGEDLAQRPEYRGFTKEWLQEIPKEPELKESTVLAAEGIKQVINPQHGQSLVRACQLTADELKEINREAEQEKDPGYLDILMDNLIEILLHLGEDMDAYENMIAFFDRTVESFLEQGSPGKAVTILRNLSETMESMVLKDKQIFAIRRILEGASTPKAIELLGKWMKGSGDADPESTEDYLQFLEKAAIDPLCLLLGGGESGKWRKMISERLVELCQDDIRPLTKFLSQKDPGFVCQILSILERVGHASTVKHLGGLIHHEDQKVREQTVEILGKSEEKGKDLLQRFMRDPAAGIRGKASLLFARAARAQAVKPLAEIVFSKDFLSRDYEEKTSFFKALAETGSEESIPILKKIAGKKSFFQRAKWNDMRQCAAKALKLIGQGYDGRAAA
jgi:hypothetical protein